MLNSSLTFSLLPPTRHLEANVRALNIHLTPEQMKSLDKALPFDYGGPQNEVRLSGLRQRYEP
jgi:hypothetical protein